MKRKNLFLALIFQSQFFNIMLIFRMADLFSKPLKKHSNPYCVSRRRFCCILDDIAKTAFQHHDDKRAITSSQLMEHPSIILCLNSQRAVHAQEEHWRMWPEDCETVFELKPKLQSMHCTVHLMLRNCDGLFLLKHTYRYLEIVIECLAKLVISKRLSSNY